MNRIQTLPEESNARLRQAAALYLAMQGLGGLAWWLLLLGWPESRAAFRATNAPDSTLLAFSAADLALYVGGSFAAAYGLVRSRPWSVPVLCVHAGAAAYAALYCLTLWMLDGTAWLGAVLMTPSLLIPPLIAWHFRHQDQPPC